MDKRDFFLDPSITFLNHGSFGACTKAMIEHQQQWIVRMEQQPVLFFRELPTLMRTSRELLGDYLSAQPEDLVFVTNSTYGVNVLANAAANVLKPGDEILTTDHEYGACAQAWLNHTQHIGASITCANIPLPAPSMSDMAELIWNKVTPSTKIIYLSHITSPTAIRLPVEELCKRAKANNILVFVDGAHAPGHIPLNLATLGADAYTGNLHKWMGTPKGSAFLWVSPELKDSIPPLVTSWGSLLVKGADGAFVDDHEYLGTRDVSAFLCIDFALKIMSKNNWTAQINDARERRVDGIRLLRSRLGLTPTSHFEDDGLLMGALLLPESVDVDNLKNVLYDRHNIEVVVLEWLAKKILRFSEYIHTTSNDVVVLADALERELP